MPVTGEAAVGIMPAEGDRPEAVFENRPGWKHYAASPSAPFVPIRHQTGFLRPPGDAERWLGLESVNPRHVIPAAGAMEKGEVFGPNFNRR